LGSYHERSIALPRALNRCVARAQIVRLMFRRFPTCRIGSKLRAVCRLVPAIQQVDYLLFWDVQGN